MTAPLVTGLVGAGVWLVYLIAVIPAWLVAVGMNENDRREPDKGTVYTWGRRLDSRLGWFSGYCLSITGIVASSGMGYVTVRILMPEAPLWIQLLSGAGIIIIASVLDSVSLHWTSFLQQVGLVAQVAALAWIGWQLLHHGLNANIAWSGSPAAWIHAVLLAVFAYWGFDSIYSLTEHTESHASTVVSMSSLASLIVLYCLASLMFVSHDVTFYTDFWLVKIAATLSAVLSLGSTLLPTARGIEAMAETGELPKKLARPVPAAIATTILTCAWLLVVLINADLFDDTIEALCVFVGLYFTSSSLIAAIYATHPIRKRFDWASTVLMGAITVLTAAQTFDSEYGATVIAGIGGVGVIVIALLSVGVIATLIATRKTPTKPLK
ncbi:MAG: hypothetical protein ACRDAX_08265 [Propionibacteriaceae bacterium]